MTTLNKHKKLTQAVNNLRKAMPNDQAYAHAFGYVSSMLTDEQIDQLLAHTERQANA
jgi:hypothetical protein